MSKLNKFHIRQSDAETKTVRAASLRNIVARLVKDSDKDLIRSRVGSKSATVVFADGDNEDRVRILADAS